MKNRFAPIATLVTSILVSLASAGPALAKDVDFAWTHPGGTGVEFELYVVPADQLDWGTPTWRGAALTTKVKDLVETTKYRATVRAAKGTNLSPISNILVFTPGAEPQTIELPEQVKELRITW